MTTTTTRDEEDEDDDEDYDEEEEEEACPTGSRAYEKRPARAAAGPGGCHSRVREEQLKKDKDALPRSRRTLRRAQGARWRAHRL